MCTLSCYFVSLFDLLHHHHHHHHYIYRSCHAIVDTAPAPRKISRREREQVGGALRRGEEEKKKIASVVKNEREGN